MDFTKIYNDGEGVEDLPQCVLNLLNKADLGYEYSEKCVRTADDDGRTTFEVGIKDAGENMNEPPFLKHDYSYLIDAMEKFKKGDDQGADEGFIRLMYDVPEITNVRKDTRRDPISRAETNAEMCLLNMRDIEAESQSWGYRGMAFLNPSVGNVKRFTQLYPKSAVPIYITEVDEDYIRRITNLCQDLQISVPYCLPIEKLATKYVYYMGFRADKAHGYNMERGRKNLKRIDYIGFSPNLLAMACANVDILSYAEHENRFVYLRKAEEISVDMRRHEFMAKADVLTYEYSKTKYYKRSQGILHDLVASVRWESDVPIIKARPIPVDLVVPKWDGIAVKRAGGIYIEGHRIMSHDGTLMYGAWKSPMNLASHRYMTGKYHGALYDAGQVERVVPIEDFIKCARESDVSGDAVDEFLRQAMRPLYKGDGHTYVQMDTGTIWLRANRTGNIRSGRHRYNKEVVGQYMMSVSAAISYSGPRLEMYGVKYVDMTAENLEIAGVIRGDENIQFGSIEEKPDDNDQLEEIPQYKLDTQVPLHDTELIDDDGNLREDWSEMYVTSSDEDSNYEQFGGA